MRRFRPRLLHTESVAVFAQHIPGGANNNESRNDGNVHFATENLMKIVIPGQHALYRRCDEEN